jgi:hypothetical protein
MIAAIRDSETEFKMECEIKSSIQQGAEFQHPLARPLDGRRKGQRSG